jgi:hypothetical protein
MKREILEKKYDELLARAKSLMAKFNPCQIKANSNGVATCAGFPNGEEPQLCCKRWVTLDIDACDCKDGCQADSLRCAIWLCGDANKGQHISVEYLPTLNVKGTLTFDSPFHFINIEHEAIFDEMIAYKLDRGFRQNKEATIQAALIAWEKEAE